MQADLACAGVHVQLTLAGIRAPVRATHGLGRGHALGGAYAAPGLSLAQGSKAALPTAVWGGGSITTVTRTATPQLDPLIHH